MEADFSGWATKAGLKCSDGRTIMADAFKHQDKMTVPLVWQHQHDGPANVLGHAVLEYRKEGIYTYGYFNETEQGQIAKALVKHKDINQLSIYANNLVEKTKQVLHGMINEVSLVIRGANPGAFIDNINLAHGDSIEILEDAAIIYTGLELEHEDKEGDSMATSTSQRTVQEVFDGLDDEEKEVVYFMIGEALDANAAQHSGLEDDAEDEDDDDEEDNDDDESEEEGDESEEDDSVQHSDQEGITIVHNVFEQQGDVSVNRPTLTHSQLETIVKDAEKMGSFKDSFLAHAVEYGIENIDLLFPDAQNLDSRPDFVKRRTEWVAQVLGGTKKSPFSRIKTRTADITHDEARAKGYVKGNLKKEEWFGLTQRVTTPTTIYKKQKLDRDDIIDITDLDVVAWLKQEMRLMLDEEIARAILIGDGREVDDDDKIKEPSGLSTGEGIRSISHDHEFYAHPVVLPTNVSPKDATEAIIRSMNDYHGSGNPDMFTTRGFLTDLLLQEDKMGRRLYRNKTELADALGVNSIIDVEVMSSEPNTLAILVNLQDYTVGTNAGGQVSMFDDFDIDYNQYKYLIETRLTGTLTKWKSAIVISRTAGTLATPTVPSFNASTGVVTIPSVTGVVYKNADTDTTLSAGAQTAIASGATVEIEAVPASGYYFPHNFDADWEFTRD